MQKIHSLTDLSDQTFHLMRQALAEMDVRLQMQEVGIVTSVEKGVVRVAGLSSVKNEERIIFPGGINGLVFGLDSHEVGVVLLDQCGALRPGDDAKRTHAVLDVPVGPELLGRVIDPRGRTLDQGRTLICAQSLPCERQAPSILERLPVVKPLNTGIKVIDAFVPIGLGQRELILGDRQSGKSSLALDIVINQKHTGVICIYCCIGQQTSAVAKMIDALHDTGALRHSIVVVAHGDSPAGLQFIAPYAATSIAEYFMSRGHDVLIVYDDLSSHARAYRELSLLLGRPPGREAFPGDIFYVHARLLERATHLKKEFGGGTLTALPIIETEAQNISGYIPTNLISITDGQIYLSPSLFQKGVLPAVDIARSVSRVGGKAQLPAYRQVAGALRLAYAQFEELEIFARFSSRLDARSVQILEHGKRIREILKQNLGTYLTPSGQIGLMHLLNSGALDQVPLAKMVFLEERVIAIMRENLRELSKNIERGQKLSPEDLQHLRLTLVKELGLEGELGVTAGAN